MIFKTTLLLVLGYSLVCYVQADEDCGDLNLIIRLWGLVINKDSWEVSWHLAHKTDCLLEYHVTVTDEELGVITDVYQEEDSTVVDRMSPCIIYELGVIVINKAVNVVGPYQALYQQYRPRPQVAPVVQSIDIQATSFNITWALEGDMNRCALTNFFIAGGDYFNVTVPLADLKNPTTVSTEIRSLKPNSMYYFQAYVENSGGKSVATQLAVQTLGN